jgi:tmRNA-binding protein
MDFKHRREHAIVLTPSSVLYASRAKIEIALARGKQMHDKRETEKARDWNREERRLLSEKG